MAQRARVVAAVEGLEACERGACSLARRAAHGGRGVEQRQHRGGAAQPALRRAAGRAVGEAVRHGGGGAREACGEGDLHVLHVPQLQQCRVRSAKLGAAQAGVAQRLLEEEAHGIELGTVLEARLELGREARVLLDRGAAPPRARDGLGVQHVVVARGRGAQPEEGLGRAADEGQAGRQLEQE